MKPTKTTLEMVSEYGKMLGVLVVAGGVLLWIFEPRTLTYIKAAVATDYKRVEDKVDKLADEYDKDKLKRAGDRKVQAEQYKQINKSLDMLLNRTQLAPVGPLRPGRN